MQAYIIFLYYGGDPVFSEPFWIANAEVEATVVPAWYRINYQMNDGLKSVVSPELEKQICAIHSLVGNAVTEGRYIVLGTRSTQLISAAVNSLLPTHASNPAQIVAATPFYGPNKSQAHFEREQALLCITVALLCLQRLPAARPSMSEVVKILSGELEPPPLPVEFSPSPPYELPFRSRRKLLRASSTHRHLPH